MIIVVSLCIIFWVYLFLSQSKKEPLFQSEGFGGNVSIIIAFRNESKNIIPLISALEDQLMIDKDKVQVVLINDHSHDNGVQIIEDWKKTTQYNINCIDLLDKQGKKSALRMGVSEAMYEQLLFTDADCIPHKYWISQMAYLFNKKNTDLLIGSVWYKESTDFFLRLQALEFSVLQSITAYSTEANWPFMCNGANIMTSKQIYNKYLLEGNTERYISGDDVFYLDFLIRNKFRIAYANSSEAMVETEAEIGLGSFIQQRLRWSSKIKYYKNIKMILPSILFSLWSVSLIFILCLLIWYPLWKVLICMGIKFIIDYTVVYTHYKKFDKRFLKFDYLTLALSYPLYVISIGILSFFKRFTWKNRVAKA